MESLVFEREKAPLHASRLYKLVHQISSHSILRPTHHLLTSMMQVRMLE